MNVVDYSNIPLKDDERAEVAAILQEIASKGNSDKYRQMLEVYYEEIPVSIDEFVENPDYLGKSTDNGKGIYPYWRNALREILHGGKSYEEIIFSGAIGLGKSLNGCIIGCYLMYKLLCLKNPQSYYNLAPNTPITFAFFNIHKYLAYNVAYGQFQRMLQDSPWFLRHGTIRGQKNVEYYPSKGINIVVGADAEHVIGMNIYFGLLDEMSFAKKPNADILKAGIMDLYRGVKARMISRFTRDGTLQAKMILISSKRSDSDFLDQYAMMQKDNPSTYLVDEPQWVVKPKGSFSEEKFRLAVGSKTKRSVIIADGDKRTDDDLLNEGYTQVIYPPLNLKPQFEFDMDANLRDLAGISTTVFTKFISYDKLQRCYTTKLSNPFENPTPSLTFDGPEQLMEYFNLGLVPSWVKNLPLYIHCDIALNGDKYGIGCVGSLGVKSQYKIQSGEMETDPVYIHVFSAKISAPKGEQVNLEKVRQFIYWLKFTQEWNIKRVSYDGFNSADSIQQMRIHQIESDLISLDRAPCNGYLTLRTAIYEKRFIMIEIPMLEDELLSLERNEMTYKVDHPVGGCFSGDTKIMMTPDFYGVREDVSFEELCSNPEKYKDYKVLSYGSDGAYHLSSYKSPRITKRVSEILEIELENGEIIKCTPDHRFLLRDGTYKEAQYLDEDDDIVSPREDTYKILEDLRSQNISDRKIGYLIRENLIDMHIQEMLSRCKISILTGISKSTLGGIISEYSRNKSDAQKNVISQGNAGAVTKIKSDPEYRERVTSSASSRITLYNNSHRDECARRIVKYNKSEEGKIRNRERMIESWRDPDKRRKWESAGNKKYGHHQYYDSIYGRFYVKSNVEKLFISKCESIGVGYLSYESESIPYNLDGQEKIYIPDFIIRHKDITYLVEVKFREPSPNNLVGLAKSEAAKKYCESNGYQYRFLNKNMINCLEDYL